MPLDVIIPCGPKDVQMLPVCVEGVRRFVTHPIKRVIVVTDNVSLVSKVLPKDFQAQVVHENDWLAHLSLQHKIRGGVLQQLIKLEARRHVELDHFLVVDADTCILKPRAFKLKRKYILRYTDSYERKYDHAIRSFMPGIPREAVSFVAHHMLFNRHILTNFIARWQQNCGRNWIECAIDLDNKTLFSFSEYELYANSLISAHPDKVCYEYWRGVDVKGPGSPSSIDEVRRRFPDAASASYHWFLRR
jgi:hypothetical protein